MGEMHNGRLHITTSHLADRVAALGPGARRTGCARGPGGGLTATEWRRCFPPADYRATCGT
ncbi:hypothetical protein [Streptomyces sp. WM6386]|uniref:hypothetical protein n=1 Tax=Streptomyces sp. WM6386 TaxID=1415558 RepID=UPI00131EC66F|nr:hypothetical protein [Streptomyces sp. WM6386]